MQGPSISPSFMRDLKNMDSRLGIKWNGRTYVITYARAFGEPVNIHQVKDENGGFRYPDRRDLEFIKGGDLSSTDMKTRLQKLSAYSEAIREKARKDARENIRHMTLDNRRQLANAAIRLTNQGKGNSTFRRIDHKPSKNAVTVIK